MTDDTRNFVGSATIVTVLKMEMNKLFRLGSVPDPPSVDVRQICDQPDKTFLTFLYILKKHIEIEKKKKKKNSKNGQFPSKSLKFIIRTSMIIFLQVVNSNFIG